MPRRQLEATSLNPGEWGTPYLPHSIFSLVPPTDPLPLPWVLQEVELRLVGEAACQCLYSRPGPFNLTFQLLPGMLCAGYPEGRKDTCQVRGGPCTCLERPGKALTNRQQCEKQTNSISLISLSLICKKRTKFPMDGIDSKWTGPGIQRVGTVIYGSTSLRLHTRLQSDSA